MNVGFNKPPLTGNEQKYIADALQGEKLSGDGQYGEKCQSWFEIHLACSKALLTPSCTQALEMAAILLDIQPGDEVIMPSYTFVSTANAFVIRGAKVVFVDIRPDTLNIDERLIEAAITPKTKAIVPVHYAGVGCDMDVIMDIANRHKLYVVEDAAQGMMSTYKGKQLGSIGHLAAFSFHETKNFTSGGEGGLLIINDPQFVARAEIIREKGTNRSQFFRGMVDKYTWVDIGSSYLPSEIQAAYLWAQLEQANQITENRLVSWNKYYEQLSYLATQKKFELPIVPEHCQHNGHMFYLKTQSLVQRTELLSHLKREGVNAVFHYVPLHNAPAGKEFSRFDGADQFTTTESERLIRLPMWLNLDQDSLNHVVKSVVSFYEKD
ncbi:dTDP-4-amino-4,6-dideoxygalactose transaminase [Methylophilus sp. 5]|uniref:dTDP-4-amino-4,6-dideoxygalactose transaminase n=1 Tax=Methylophilus sp. 5 TaxID=1112274 RepID=UPI00048E0E3E|nr:dTDP-4-amino-4,6-dideoxygalactose transaminase [Methylophilus sp. 5]